MNCCSKLCDHSKNFEQKKEEKFWIELLSIKQIGSFLISSIA